eukprot:RCo053839
MPPPSRPVRHVQYEYDSRRSRPSYRSSASPYARLAPVQPRLRGDPTDPLVRISASTDVSGAAGALARHVRDGNTVVHVEAAGCASVYQAVRSICMARSYLAS